MTVLTGAAIFDGTRLLHGQALVLAEGRIAALIPAGAAPPDAQRLPGGILAPGLVDLQVNGGGGVMVGPGTDAARLATVCAAQRGGGVLACLPTLITDTPGTTAQVIAAGIEAARRDMPGFLPHDLRRPALPGAVFALGLMLRGPHGVLP